MSLLPAAIRKRKCGRHLRSRYRKMPVDFTDTPKIRFGLRTYVGPTPSLISLAARVGKAL